MTEPEKSLQNQTVVFTGKLACCNRQQAQQWVQAAGARCVGAVSKKTSLVVVGMLGFPVLKDGTISKTLAQAEQLQQQGLDLEIISETVLLERLGRKPAQVSQNGSMELAAAAKLLQVTETDIRRWEQFGLVRLQQGKVSFQDLVSLRNIAQLLKQGLNIESINRTLHALQTLIPDLQRPLAQARLLQHGDQSLLVELQGVTMNSSGQLLLDFDAAEAADQAPKTKAIAPQVPAPGKHTTLADTALPQAEQHRRQQDYAQAIEHYRHHLQQHENDALAWYNLGYCLDETGELLQAAHAFEQAIALQHDYTDAIFNLARCYERLHQHQNALPHWKRYVELDGKSEWGKIARRFIHYG
ncbi:MAG: MerR family transcriptional regulator [Gammaproteobacteria bacterium]|nr:MerR family transcriptional regulator [Gammaproteobacteria bacterium]MDH5801472.1 MerR family transcriptional regulator [Gammaproteobacteria bacterium]